MKKSALIAAVIFFTLPARAQHVIQVPPLQFNSENIFHIKSVEDMRTVRQSVGTVQKGFANRQTPAVFDSELEIFLRSYLNAALGNVKGVPVYLKVKKFWIWEETRFSSETGRIETHFEAWIKSPDGFKKILDEPFLYEVIGVDVTRNGHGENVHRVLGKLLAKIDAANLESAFQVELADSINPVQYDGVQPEEVPHESVKKTSRREYELHEFGGPVSLGIALGGGGILGLPLRVFPAQKVAFEAGVYYRPFLQLFNDELVVHSGLMLTGAACFYPSKQKINATQARLQGLFLKGGYSFGKYPEAMGVFGWAMEKIKIENNSFSADVGIGFTVLNSDDNYFVYALTKTNVQPIIYFQLRWAWYLLNFNPKPLRSTPDW